VKTYHVIRRFSLSENVVNSVTRIRLVQTENPGACVTVNWKLCKSATGCIACKHESSPLIHMAIS
jgi:hypothetical protein